MYTKEIFQLFVHEPRIMFFCFVTETFWVGFCFDLFCFCLILLWYVLLIKRLPKCLPKKKNGNSYGKHVKSMPFLIHEVWLQLHRKIQ